MSDVVTLARNARELLARGLNALQGDPHVPAHLLDLAAPIAQAMGALHNIERTGGAQTVPSAQAALSNVQTALAQLQAQPPRQPAVAAALEAVAAALGAVHTLLRSAQAPAPVAQAPAASRAPYPQPAPQQPPAAPAYAPTAQQPARQAPRPATGSAYANAPKAPLAQPAAQAASPGGESVTAELGAHSPTNFYKGLSGNDIIDHGGLFVSTYKLPKIGASVRLRVSLPGGYEFEANAVVRWRREPSDAGNDAPPGFGAQFTDIATEARQLVYRYVRNREPLFHDDL